MPFATRSRQRAGSEFEACALARVVEVGSTRPRLGTEAVQDLAMDERTLYRFAGLIDADGGIRLEGREGRTKAAVVYLHSTSTEIIDWLIANVGGYAILKPPAKKHHRPVLVWRSRGRDAVRLCECLAPVLLESSKRARANLIARDYIRLTPRNGRYSEQMKADRAEFERMVEAHCERAAPLPAS